ncbi:MAG: hypothetical protein ACJ74U_13960 [Jatrophihabitantaceae bacterium]
MINQQYETGEHRAAATPGERRVTIHLTAQATVDFTADQLWPLHGDYARFGPDLPSFAQEVTRRLRADGYVGYRPAEDRITVIPLDSIKRIDFSHTS